MANKYLPINLSMRNRSCLIVGGGQVALRKIEYLLDYDTQITVVAPEIDKRIEFYAEKNKLTVEKRKYKSPEAASYGLVISACDDNKVNEQVSADCRAARVPVNVVDNPPLCDIIFPAVLRRDCLTVAVSTDGKAPYMAGFLRMILEDVFPKQWNQIAAMAASFRKMVQKRWPDNALKRTDCFNRFLQTDWKTLIDEKKEAELKNYLECLLEDQENEEENT
ncbi:MAG: precorrin-2 dehydrogenase/sirohydrochlorin ferrochelatase family protein [Candidatus Zixiibacteriota bacterium]